MVLGEQAFCPGISNEPVPIKVEHIKIVSGRGVAVGKRRL